MDKPQTTPPHPIDIRLYSPWGPEKTEIEAILRRETKGVREFIVRMFPKEKNNA